MEKWNSMTIWHIWHCSLYRKVINSNEYRTYPLSVLIKIMRVYFLPEIQYTFKWWVQLASIYHNGFWITFSCSADNFQIPENFNLLGYPYPHTHKNSLIILSHKYNGISLGEATKMLKDSVTCTAQLYAFPDRAQQMHFEMICNDQWQTNIKWNRIHYTLHTQSINGWWQMHNFFPVRDGCPISISSVPVCCLLLLAAFHHFIRSNARWHQRKKKRKNYVSFIQSLSPVWRISHISFHLMLNFCRDPHTHSYI